MQNLHSQHTRGLYTAEASTPLTKRAPALLQPQISCLQQVDCCVDALLAQQLLCLLCKWLHHWPQCLLCLLHHAVHIVGQVLQQARLLGKV